VANEDLKEASIISVMISTNVLIMYHDHYVWTVCRSVPKRTKKASTRTIYYRREGKCEKGCQKGKEIAKKSEREIEEQKTCLSLQPNPVVRPRPPLRSLPSLCLNLRVGVSRMSLSRLDFESESTSVKRTGS
jgi:hypothetical protein